MGYFCLICLFYCKREWGLTIENAKQMVEKKTFFYGDFFPEGSCSKLFKGLECLKNSQGKEIDRESTDETAKG